MRKRGLSYLVLQILVVLLLSACDKEQVKQGVYTGLHDRQCVVEGREPNCDPDRLPYDEYKKEREKMKKE